MKNRLFNTSAWRITRVYASLLAGIAVILSLVIISVVGVKQYDAQKQKAIGIARALKRSEISTKDDWLWWRAGSSTNNHHTFIRLRLIKKNGSESYLYSPNTKRFLTRAQKSKGKKVSMNVYYSPRTGFYYHAKSLQSDSSYAAIHYDVWVELNGVLNLLWLLIRLILLITFIFLVLGTWVIYLLARRLNQPLVQLTKTTKKINRDLSDQYQSQLPVPQSPQEVHDLSVEFNHLLRSLSDQAQADRQFVSNASHELKTPIAAIRGHVSLIQRRGRSHPDIIPTSLAFIDQESGRMQRLIESLLQLSHANQLELKFEQVNLSELMIQMVAELGSTLNRKIEATIQPDVLAVTNSDSIRQILTSLMTNAQKYSPADQPIGLTMNATGRKIMLTVSDFGRGVSDEEKPHVFERFYRTKAVRNQVKGNGLGLAIVYQLVLLMHGEIKVEDNVPNGACFTVTLPQQ
ncbi:HAMP domain-containing sensor histidine kinase [Secundilactobacillus folii]|uniref:histidine kinase n=1 Tax=Secundilactobacillus folii TaxID=2678357 RepID=A0A7X2XVB3_9LACO|nr:HAMP domain-containing sensor histidine kinase [Secundilactobacillus folii]MTV82286.1 HAMP domain-containing protein [Secundilactobacillus folii]